MDNSEEYFESIDIDDSRNDLSKLLSSLLKLEIKEYIVEKILYFYQYNSQLNIKIKQNYGKIKSPYFEEFYILNNDWISKFLSFYNYEKIFSLLENWNGEITVKKLSSELSWNNINQKSENMPDEMKDNQLFMPKSDNKFGIKYYLNFILIDNNLFQRLKNDNGNINIMNYNFDFEEPIKANICLVENKFIYQIDDYSLGFGIVNKNNNYPVINIDFLIILDKESGYNSDTEINQIFSLQNLETFFTESRRINFSENENPKKIYDQSNKKIGKFYSFDTFLYGNYFQANIFENIKPHTTSEKPLIRQKYNFSSNESKTQDNSNNNNNTFVNIKEEKIKDNTNNINEITNINESKNISNINNINSINYNNSLNDSKVNNNKNNEKTEIIEEK